MRGGYLQGAIILPTTHPDLHTSSHSSPMPPPVRLALLVPFYGQDTEAHRGDLRKVTQPGSGRVQSQIPG